MTAHSWLQHFIFSLQWHVQSQVSECWVLPAWPQLLWQGGWDAAELPLAKQFPAKNGLELLALKWCLGAALVSGNHCLAPAKEEQLRI